MEESPGQDEVLRLVYRRSFLGTLPESRQTDLLDVAQVVEYSGGSLVYDPQLSLIVSGAFGALVYGGLCHTISLVWISGVMVV